MTHLDATAIREIETLVRNSDPIIAPPQEVHGVYFVPQPDGTLLRQRTTLDEESRTALDLQSFMLETGEALQENQALRVLADDRRVTLQNENEDGTHRWTVTLPLPLHPAFEIVREWRKPCRYTHKELMRLLRTELNLYVDATVISLLSSLRFNSSSEGGSVMKAHSSALDKRVIQQVQADAGQAVPDSIVLTPPVYDIPEDRDEQYPVTVYLEYDHEESLFVLCAVHGDLRRAEEKAIGKVIAQLRDAFQTADLPVLYGKAN